MSAPIIKPAAIATLRAIVLAVVVALLLATSPVSLLYWVGGVWLSAAVAKSGSGFGGLGCWDVSGSGSEYAA